MIVYAILAFNRKEESFMAMERIMIQLPKALKGKLDNLKAQGYTASGFVRFLLERELNSPKKKGT